MRFWKGAVDGLAARVAPMPLRNPQEVERDEIMGVRRNIEDMVDKMVLLQARIVVAALIAGQLFFAAVIAYLHHSGSFSSDATFPELVLQIVAVVGVLLYPIALLLRRKTWGTTMMRSTAESKGAYLRGYIVFHAILEGGSLLNLVFWLVTGVLIPNVVAAAILVGLQILNFPRADRLPQANR